MKNCITLIAAIFFIINTFAQAPQKMSYQAVIRNNSNALVISKAVGMRVSILQGSATGTEVYKEIYNPNPETNANGLVTIEIGGGVPLTGSFASINWASGPYFIKTEIDPNGGTAYTITGTSQLLSVPYALYAGNVVNGGGKPILYLEGDITNTQAQAKIAAEVGPNTQQVFIDKCTVLTAIDLSIITGAVSINISNNENLQTINLSKLEVCRDIEITNCPKLNTLSFSALKQLSYLYISQTALTSLSLNALTEKTKASIELNSNPQLATVTAQNIIKADNITITQNKLLTTVSLPALQFAENIYVDNNDQINGLNFQSLKAVGNLNLTSNQILTNIGLPQLQSVRYLYIVANNNVNSLSFPALTTAGLIQIFENNNLSSIQLQNLSVFSEVSPPSPSGYNFVFNNNKLPTSQINTLLNKLVNLTPALSGANIYLNRQTPLAPPTGQGLIDKTTLISRGNQVFTD
jgi:hypothetical protein